MNSDVLPSNGHTARGGDNLIPRALIATKLTWSNCPKTADSLIDIIGFRGES